MTERGAGVRLMPISAVYIIDMMVLPSTPLTGTTS